MLALWPGFSVVGKIIPEAKKPVPAAAAALTMTGLVPVDVRVTDFVTAVFSGTLPNERELALTFSVGIAAFNCKAKLFVTETALAVRATD